MIYEKSCSKIYFLLNCQIAKENLESIGFKLFSVMPFFGLVSPTGLLLSNSVCGHTRIRHLVQPPPALTEENGNENFH